MMDAKQEQADTGTPDNEPGTDHAEPPMTPEMNSVAPPDTNLSDAPLNDEPRRHPKVPPRPPSLSISSTETSQLHVADSSDEDEKRPPAPVDKSWLDTQRRRVREEQAARREVLMREQQNVMGALEKEQAHWKKQDLRFKKMIERMKVGQRTCEELLQFLQRGTKGLTMFGEHVLQQGSFGSEETGTLRQASIAQDLLRTSIHEHYSEMKDRVFADSVKQSTNLAKTMHKRSANMEAAGTRMRKNVRLHRDKVSEAWQAYSKAVNDRHKSELSNKPVSKDPFLACRVYEREVADLRVAEKAYTKEMSRIFLELRVDDGRRIDAIKSILLDYLLAQKALLEHTVKFTESAIASVKSIDREKDVMEFVTHADLLLTTRAPEERERHTDTSSTIFEVPPPNRDPGTITRLYSQEVEREGFLSRQGRFFKSNWKPVYVAVSSSGFLHYFDDRKDSTPSQTIALAHCQCSIAPQVDEFAFEIVEPNRGFFSWHSENRYAFKAETEEQMVDWMVSIKKYTDREYDDETSVTRSASTLDVHSEDDSEPVPVQPSAQPDHDTEDVDSTPPASADADA